MKSAILVGGQAVIDGVMMRVPGAYATAVRLSDQTIHFQKHNFISIIDKYKLQKLYFIRGMIHLYESMRIGYSTLDWSAFSSCHMISLTYIQVGRYMSMNFILTSSKSFKFLKIN